VLPPDKAFPALVGIRVLQDLAFAADVDRAGLAMPAF
jgi:hypothetical protein